MDITSTMNNKVMNSQLKLLDNSKSSLMNQSGSYNNESNIKDLEMKLLNRKSLFKNNSFANKNVIYKRNYSSNKQLQTVSIKKKSTSHPHKRAQTFIDKNEVAQVYLAEALKENESRTKEGRYKSKIAFANLLIAISAIITIVLGIIDSEINIKKSNSIIHNKTNVHELTSLQILEILVNRVISPTENVIRISALVFNVIIVGLIIYQTKIHYSFRSQDKKKDITQCQSFIDFLKYLLRKRIIDIIISHFFFDKQIEVEEVGVQD